MADFPGRTDKFSGRSEMADFVCLGQIQAMPSDVDHLKTKELLRLGAPTRVGDPIGKLFAERPHHINERLRS
jgi:hypothetical protein